MQLIKFEIKPGKKGALAKLVLSAPANGSQPELELAYALKVIAEKYRPLSTPLISEQMALDSSAHSVYTISGYVEKL